METICDQHGHVLGYLDREALSNAIVARNREGHIVAIYDVPSNTTRLPNGHIVGSGNTIAVYLVAGR
jgi:hypothetical protein